MRTPRPRVLVSVALLALIPALAFAASGCGRSPDAGDGAPTTLQADASTSTLPAQTTTPTTSAPPTTAAPSTTAPSVTTTEPLSDAETLLPNGNIRAMGFIRQIGDINQKNYIWINHAEFLTGDEAKSAAIEAGVIALGEELDNDYFIANKDPKRRQFEVSGSVAITTSTYEGVMERSITWEEFRSFWSLSPAPGTTYLRDVPWWIERDGGMVVKIEEQYLP
jgi:hypothetical protein